MPDKESTIVICHHVHQFEAWRYVNVRRDHKVGLISTKGCIHQGHLGIAQVARQHCDLLILTICAYPGQFPDYKDYERFPRTLSRDLELIKNSGLIDVVVAPPLAELFKYGATHGAAVHLESDILPREYFDLRMAQGECTILVKTINYVKPTIVFVGQKDLVRARMIQRLVDDLNYSLDIIMVPTVRDDSGVAYDARLDLLSPAQRLSLSTIYRALNNMVNSYLRDEFNSETLIQQGKDILSVEPILKVQFVRVAHPYGFQNIETIDPAIGGVVAIQVSVEEKVVLYDNMIMAPLIPAHEQTLWSLVKSTKEKDKTEPIREIK